MNKATALFKINKLDEAVTEVLKIVPRDGL